MLWRLGRGYLPTAGERLGAFRGGAVRAAVSASGPGGCVVVPAAPPRGGFLPRDPGSPPPEEQDKPDTLSADLWETVDCLPGCRWAEASIVSEPGAPRQSLARQSPASPGPYPPSLYQASTLSSRLQKPGRGYHAPAVRYRCAVEQLATRAPPRGSQDQGGAFEVRTPNPQLWHGAAQAINTGNGRDYRTGRITAQAVMMDRGKERRDGRREGERREKDDSTPNPQLWHGLAQAINTGNGRDYRTGQGRIGKGRENVEDDSTPTIPQA
ncbi:hypothetical protein Bbelb_235730 [Branchiostoma belcheri]|nr:hypothetical protein Bbelb_235730 [Branchiostoma belcheri]